MSSQERLEELEGVANILLKEGFLLAALELYQEAVEDGIQLDSLKKKFEQIEGIQTDPSETPSTTKKTKSKAINEAPEQEQIQKKEFAILKERADKLDNVEYELRVAKETISDLKSQLTTLTDQLNAVNNYVPLKQKKDKKNVNQLLGVGSQSGANLDKRALNYIVYQYFFEQGYKLTAITFEEEANDQDLSDWGSVGLNISEPPPLREFYRNFYNSEKSQREEVTIKEENMQLRNELSKTERDYLQLKVNYEKLIQEKRHLEQQLGIATEEPESTAQVDSSGNSDASSTASAAVSSTRHSKLKLRRPWSEFATVGNSSTKADSDQPDSAQNDNSTTSNVTRSLVEVTVRPEDANSYARICQVLMKLAKLKVTERDRETIIKIIAECLPHIIPGVIFKKRDELIPVFVAVISQHPQESVRLSLLQLLFNLIKKPLDYERKMLVDGFVSLASIVGPDRTEVELLTRCWEEVTNKYSERRQLVADACGGLGAYVRPELRQSLILSVLKQLANDKNASVRESVARNLGYVVTLLEGAEKYNQVQDLAFELLYDENEEVRTITKNVLLVTLADWADSLDLLFSQLFSRLLTEIETIVSSSVYQDTGGIINQEDDLRKLDLLFSCFIALIPKLRSTIMLSAHYSASALQDTNQPGQVLDGVYSSLTPAQIKKLEEKFQSFMASKFTPSKGSVEDASLWPELDWLANVFLSKLISLILKVDVVSLGVSEGFINITSSLATAFGPVFTTQVLKKKFEEQWKPSEKKAKEEKMKRSRLLPTYLVGVLGSLEDKDLVQYLKELISMISLEENGWSRDHTNVLKDSVRMLCKNSERKSQILNLFKDLAVHPANYVRSCVVSLFNSMITVLNSDEVGKRVVPILITLASDPDKLVRSASIQAFGNVAINMDDTLVVDKIKNQFDTFLEDDAHATKVEIAKTFSNIIPNVSQPLRDTYILPKVAAMVEKNSHNTNNMERRELAKFLFENFRAFSSCNIDHQAISVYILPSLRILLNEAEFFEPSYRSLINSMIGEMEALVKPFDEAAKDKQHKVDNQQSKAFFDIVRGGFKINK